MYINIKNIDIYGDCIVYKGIDIVLYFLIMLYITTLLILL